MSVKVASNRFIIPSLKEYSDLLQHLRGSASIFQHLGNKLVKEAEIAQAFRHTSRVEELGSILSNLPLREYRLAGQYYLAWCDYRRGKDPRLEIEKIIEQSDTFRAKAFLTLSVLQEVHGEYELGFQSCQAAIRCNPSPSIITQATRGIAILKSREGFNKSAFKDLEMISSIVRYADPMNYHQYLNSLAVEMGELGRIEEAQNVCRITLASPFINAYPEWRETWQELALRGYKSRSVVSVLKPALDSDNVVPLPVVERSSDPPQQGQARIFDLQKWAKKMGKKPNGNGKKLPENMTSRDMVIKLMNLTTQEGISDEKLQKIIDYVEKLLSEPD
jgi:tetratricopeptide (TPR) repeat protein